MPDLEVPVPWSLRPGPEQEAAAMEASAQALDLYTHQPFEQKHKAPSPYPPVSLFNNNLPMAYSSASLRWEKQYQICGKEFHLGFCQVFVPMCLLDFCLVHVTKSKEVKNLTSLVFGNKK